MSNKFIFNSRLRGRNLNDLEKRIAMAVPRIMGLQAFTACSGMEGNPKASGAIHKEPPPMLITKTRHPMCLNP